MMKNNNQSVLGLGSDIIEIGRIEECLEQYHDRFLKRVFTPKERDYCLKYKDPSPRLAGRFAAKEAIVKALGTGFGEVSWQEVEIINDSSGKPQVVLSEKINQKYGNPHIHLTISHCHEYALAVALWSRTN